jgi:hypothetical protein
MEVDIVIDALDKLDDAAWRESTQTWRRKGCVSFVSLVLALTLSV